MRDIFGYQGKRVVVTGAASGMGQATVRLLVELGAEVYALDVKEVAEPVRKYVSTDLSRQESIDAALAQIPGHVDRIFTCAGLPGPPFSDIAVNLVNFVGHRHLVESLLPRMSEGGAIAMIASVGGMAWQMNFATVSQLLATQDFEAARAWLEANPEAARGFGEVNSGLNAYGFSKQCLVAYVKTKAWGLGRRKIRINTLSPGTTETPMTPAFNQAYGKEVCDLLVGSIGRYATPEEMANPLVFLNSDMASYISGHDLQVDYGFVAAILTGQKKFGAA